MDHFEHDLDDPELASALRRHADRLTGPIDTEAALTDVSRRGRAARRRRLTAIVGAAAAAVIVVGAFVATLGDDPEVLRAPATQPTTTVVTAVPVMTTPFATTPATAAMTTQWPPPPTTRTYLSNGGSITIRVADGQISLDGAPVATAGWSTRIDDNGPDRVRVRFELDDRRSEIRVDLVDGEPVERITED